MERLETHAALDKPLIVTCSPEHSVRHTHTLHSTWDTLN